MVGVNGYGTGEIETRRPVQDLQVRTVAISGDATGDGVNIMASYLVPGLRKEQVLPLVQPQYGSLEAMQFLQRHNQSLSLTPPICSRLVAENLNSDSIWSWMVESSGARAALYVFFFYYFTLNIFKLKVVF